MLERRGGTLTRDPLPVVRADAGLVRRLWLELLGNALSFAGDAPPRIHVGWEEGEVAVRDHGIGIDPAVADQVFQPFRRLDASAGGRGLGLALCRRIVERHGGRIRLESRPGEGATFSFSLGEVLETPGAGDAAGPPEPRGAGGAGRDEAPAGAGAFDRAQALEHCFGDEALLAEIAGLFLQRCPELLDEAARAVEAGDADAVRQAAHQLKSMAGNVGGRDLAAAALRLEGIGRGGDLTEAAEALSALLAEADRLLPALRVL